jgi:glycine cleavage system transcriptional repressor
LLPNSRNQKELFMARYLLTAQSHDRPGVVAVVSGVIAEHGWSIDDASMTRLAGRFAMLMVMNVPETMSIEEVRAAVNTRLEPASMLFTLEPVADQDEAPTEGSAWTVTVYGSDRPGIVSAITRTMARRSVNIENLATRATEGPAGHVYSMLIDVTVPTAVDGDAFASELAEVANALGVTCHATPVEVDVF